MANWLAVTAAPSVRRVCAALAANVPATLTVLRLKSTSPVVALKLAFGAASVMSDKSRLADVKAMPPPATNWPLSCAAAFEVTLKSPVVARLPSAFRPAASTEPAWVMTCAPGPLAARLVLPSAAIKPVAVLVMLP